MCDGLHIFLFLKKGVIKMSDGVSLYAAQTNDVEQMRNCLLTFDRKDPNAIKKAIQNVTLLRVYHQLERIVRFTEVMDQLEDRIYQSIQAKLDNADSDDENMFLTLIPIQERLQKTMVESHKLLEPYLTMEQLTVLEVPTQEDPTKAFASMILDQESREKVRTGVQSLLQVINTFDGQAADVTDKQSVQSEAQKALAELQGRVDAHEGT